MSGETDADWHVKLDEQNSVLSFANEGYDAAPAVSFEEAGYDAPTTVSFENTGYDAPST